MGIKITGINITKISGENVGIKLNSQIIIESMKRANIPTPRPRRLPREDNVTSYYDHEKSHQYNSLIEKSFDSDKQKRRL